MKEFTVDETKEFRLACRKHNCTIQSAAQIASCIAIGNVKGAEKFKKSLIH